MRLSLSPASRRYLDNRSAAKRAYNLVRHVAKPEAPPRPTPAPDCLGSPPSSVTTSYTLETFSGSDVL
jgi:hypothetical protein